MLYPPSCGRSSLQFNGASHRSVFRVTSLAVERRYARASFLSSSLAAPVAVKERARRAVAARSVGASSHTATRRRAAMAWQAERRGYKAPMDFSPLIQRKRELFADLEGEGEESNMRILNRC
jgi:hypothetical protein